jgi:uncharacterized protein YdiU (UPF0061 family)
MALVEEARRWVKDQFVQDENVNGRPQGKIRELSDALVHLTPAERKRNVEHLKAYVDYYYQGHHNEAVPAEIRQQLGRLDRQVERLNTVDQARQILQKYGGPPTKETVAESLERSARQREKEVVKTVSRTPQEVAHAPSLEV